jgi:hypothetical protein
VGDFFEDGAQPHQLILNNKRDNVGEFHFFFLAIGKTGHVFSFYQRRALVVSCEVNTISIFMFLLQFLVATIPINCGRREPSEQKLGG